MATEEKPAEESTSDKKSASVSVDKLGLSDILETELQCSVCHEPFVMTTTLNCGHSFCATCIDTWMDEKTMCPVCRAPISSRTRSIAFDNYIERVIENLDEDTRSKRKQLVEQRKSEMERRRERNGAVLRPVWFADPFPTRADFPSLEGFGLGFGLTPFGGSRNRPLFLNASDDEPDDYFYSDDDAATVSQSDSEHYGDSWFQQRFRASPTSFAASSNSNADASAGSDQPATSSSQQRRQNVNPSARSGRRTSPFSRSRRDGAAGNDSAASRAGSHMVARGMSWAAPRSGRDWAAPARGAFASRERRSRGAHSSRGSSRSQLRFSSNQMPFESAHEPGSNAGRAAQSHTHTFTAGGWQSQSESAMRRWNVPGQDSWISQSRAAPLANGWNANVSPNYTELGWEAFHYQLAAASHGQPTQSNSGWNNVATHQSNWNAQPQPQPPNANLNSVRWQPRPAGASGGANWGWNQHQQQSGHHWGTRSGAANRPGTQNQPDSTSLQHAQGPHAMSQRSRFGSASRGRGHRFGQGTGWPASADTPGPSNYWWSRYSRWADQRYAPPTGAADAATVSVEPSGWPQSSNSGVHPLQDWTARDDVNAPNNNNAPTPASRQRRGPPSAHPYATTPTDSQSFDVERWLNTHDYLPDDFDASDWLSRHPDADPHIAQRLILLATARAISVGHSRNNEPPARTSQPHNVNRNLAVYARSDAGQHVESDEDSHAEWLQVANAQFSSSGLQTQAQAQAQAAADATQTQSANRSGESDSRLTDAMRWLSLEQPTGHLIATPIGTGSNNLTLPFFGQSVPGFVPFGGVGVGFPLVVGGNYSQPSNVPSAADMTPSYFVPPFSDAAPIQPFASATQAQPNSEAQNTPATYTPQFVATSRNG